jgi:hypothetical protein
MPPRLIENQEGMLGVAKRLPLHASGSRRLADRHSPKRMGNAKHATARPVVLLRPRSRASKHLWIGVISEWSRGGHGQAVLGLI